jgi:hypothetical protein
MWGVTPAWQGAPEAFGGLSTQTQQLVVMSRVVEGDQRLFHEKIFPQILEAFGITDWSLKLPNPEEKAEATRISFSQQKAQIAQQFIGLGFDVRLKEDGVPVEDAEFMIYGKPVNMAEMQGEQLAMGLEQQEQQMQMMEQQQEQQQEAPPQAPAPPPGVNQAPGRSGAAPGGGEGQGAAPIPPMPMQQMDLGKDAEKPKDFVYNSLSGNRTPHDDEYYENRKSDDDPTKPVNLNRPQNWVEGLMSKGFLTPIIKEVSNDGKKMWFSQDGTDYIANLTSFGVNFIEKADFYNGPNIQKPKGPSVNPQISYNVDDQQDWEENDANPQNRK